MSQIEIAPEHVESIDKFYGPGMCRDLIADHTAKMIISPAGIRAHVEEDYEAMTYALTAELGAAQNKEASLKRAIAELGAAHQAFLAQTETPIERQQAQAAARAYWIVSGDVADLVWDTEPAGAHGPEMDFDSLGAYLLKGARS